MPCSTSPPRPASPPRPLCSNKVAGWSGPFDVALGLDSVYSLAAQFITSCPASNPTLPVKAFPKLTFAAGAKPGATVELTFDVPKGKKADELYAAFYTGEGTEYVKVSSAKKVAIPMDLIGTVYAVITTSGTASADANTVAVLDLSSTRRASSMLNRASAHPKTSPLSSLTSSFSPNALVATPLFSLNFHPDTRLILVYISNPAGLSRCLPSTAPSLSLYSRCPLRFLRRLARSRCSNGFAHAHAFSSGIFRYEHAVPQARRQRHHSQEHSGQTHGSRRIGRS